MALGEADYNITRYLWLPSLQLLPLELLPLERVPVQPLPVSFNQCSPTIIVTPYEPTSPPPVRQHQAPMPKRRLVDIPSGVPKEGDLNECHPNETDSNEGGSNEGGEPQEEGPATPKKRSRKKKDATSVPLTREQKEKVPLTSLVMAASPSFLIHKPVRPLHVYGG